MKRIDDRINRDYITSYIRGLLDNEEGKFYNMENYARENNIPIIEKEVAKLMEVLVKIKKPKRILEIGTAIGYSSIVMCDALDGKCQITTMEKNKEMIKEAKKNIRSLKYEEQIEIICGDAIDEFSKLDRGYDLIFIDAAKGQYKKFFDASLDLLNPRGLIISDNILFKGMVASDKLVDKRMKTIVKRLREYLDYISNLDDCETAVIPIGDGVALTYREG